MLRKGVMVLLVLGLLVGVLASLTISSADPPGPGDKQCTPGQNNIGGGPGNSGNGDKNGAPLKVNSCPGG